MDQFGRCVAVHAVFVFVGGGSWFSVVRSQFVLVQGPLDAFVAVSLPQVGVEFDCLPEHLHRQYTIFSYLENSRSLTRGDYDVRQYIIFSYLE